MVSKRLGKLPPCYAFMLNPYSDVRLSKCPKCQKLTHFRKFALFLHVEEWGPLTLGKTCRYCSRCELIIVHQDELEEQLAHILERLAPEIPGTRYLVIGTLDKKVWQRGLSGEGSTLAESLRHLADFRKHYDLEYTPGGWYPADQEPPKRRQSSQDSTGDGQRSG